MKRKALVELPKALLEKGTPFRFRAKGFSMSPFIQYNDLVTVSPLKNASPRTGDIVLFNHPEVDRLFIHRIVKKIKGAYVIRGDNSRETDGIIPEKNILGRVSGIQRNGKKIPLGLGRERLLIALLSRKRFLASFLTLHRLIPAFIKKQIS